MSTYMLRCNAKLSKKLTLNYCISRSRSHSNFVILVDTITLLKIKFYKNQGLLFLGISGQRSRSMTFTTFFFQIPQDAYQLVEQCFKLILKPKQHFRTIRAKVISRYVLQGNATFLQFFFINRQ